MDSRQFDDLLRVFSHSRRAAIASLLTLASGLDTPTSEARKKRKRKKKKRKGSRSCTPNCSGKTCGDDGCGGTCGDCFQGTCAAGNCSCPAGTEYCGGACRAKCSGSTLRHPDTCECCGKVERPCGFDSHCCSGQCSGGFCKGRNGLEVCSFDEQCESRECREGTCTCRGTICNGVCGPTCHPPRAAQNPATCACCVNNGYGCIDGSCTCCCSGLCDGPPGQKACVGRAAGASCEFGGQCASGTCHLVPVGNNFYVYECA